jgi:hypothetical protein
MKTCHTDADKIWKVWNWCSDSYLRHGIRLSFPKHTDPVKTYQWRYCRSLTEKLEEWDFDDETSCRFIDIAVQHAKSIGVLRKGLAVLHQGNMLGVVYDLLQQESEFDDQSIQSLVYIKKWFDQQISDGNLITYLLERPHPGSYCNITIWYQANRLSPLFISLSRSCCKALNRLKKLDEEERGLLPKVTELYRLRSDFTDDVNCLKKAKDILGEDWRELCH